MRRKKIVYTLKNRIMCIFYLKIVRVKFNFNKISIFDII